MVLKNILDYYDLICAEYPTVPKSDIKKILLFGYKLLYLVNSYGCDVVIERGNFWFYCGTLFKNSLIHFKYYGRKLTTKLRILFKRNKIKWDGYYYFALSLKLYDQYKSQLKKRGRPKKIFTFTNVLLRKLYDEVVIQDGYSVAIFRIPILDEIGYTKFYYTLTTGNAELVTEKLPTKMIDIMTSTHEYEIIKNKKYKK